mmetsp:Transcript_15160/g.18386  ORF Transcript_15160/g.18386 Transcript_15160/m.18386 type:complete len:489 (+) Transcript_15160:153-1619(+)|eukprot:CAMPEP_0184019876 /NCGR_PEP_ID=MMETSP0954-20121128/9012_1 /TAXON_ID=627963 /ORGANISM="Aplanochytrium sp, Strain PBS07" /LENGTH=488 /DNA_ID=CAMNT_0026301625 /DNA_START=39 /DNA_END=1505 /DNA_ORIENTATION=+
MPSQEAQSIIDEVLPSAVSWAAAHGLSMVAPENDSRFIHAPMSLLPTKFPREYFEKAISLSQSYNKLVDKVARDETWLLKTLEKVSHGDEFTNKLIELCKEVIQRGVSQEFYLGIHRSDYMLNAPENAQKQLLQVELNTIASSFGCLSSRVSKMHKFLSSNGNTRAAFNQHYSISNDVREENTLPVNDADKNISSGIAAAAKLYSESQDDSSHPQAVMFVIQEGERNSFDQRWLEYNLFDAHQVVTLRRTLSQVAKNAILKDDNKLIIDGFEISVVYFRAGYTPNDYPGEVEWNGRRKLEFSQAIKCPSIAYHLVGTKKVQQKLALEGELEKFIDDENECKALRSTFAGLWSLDVDEQTEGEKQAQKQAMVNPEGYVMKPQREGGGNNIYGKDIASALSSMCEQERAAFILMQRIFPTLSDTILVRESKAVLGKAISELGIYSVFLGNGKKTVCDGFAGYLLRTKMEGVDEGGVATGYSCLDSVFLTD